jgi:hypothetical protein
MLRRPRLLRRVNEARVCFTRTWYNVRSIADVHLVLAYMGLPLQLFGKVG